MQNEDLKARCNKMYRDGEDKFFSKYQGGRDISETNAMVIAALDWTGKRVIDVGCGAGHVAAEIAARGALSVCGIDYAEAAVEKANAQYARENLEFRCMSLAEWSQPVDCLVSLGTLEHMDDPAGALRNMAALLAPGGKIVLTCPCFINLRGFVWMTLQLLQQVPMSLTDLHFLSPFDIEAFAKPAGLEVEKVGSCDFAKGNGDQMLTDLDKRLNNALRDAGISAERVPALLAWLERVARRVEKEGAGPLMGATGFYVLGQAPNGHKEGR